MPISCLRLHEYRNKERNFTSAGYVVIAYNKKFTYEKRKKKAESGIQPGIPK